MTASNGKKKGTAAKKLERLAQLKFDYELLTNELFHLKEFMSLVEFDPSYENDSESYKRFLVDGKLSLESLGGQEDENEDQANNGRVRRRQLRASTTTPAGNEDVNSIVWAEIEPVVRAKYNDLKSALQGDRHMKRNQVLMKRARTPKLSNKKSSKLLSPISNGSSALSTATKHGDQVKSEDLSEESFGEGDVYYGQNIQEDYYFTTSSEDEPENRRQRQRKRPRLNLIVNPPKQTVTNPLHVNKPQFTNLHEYINSFKSMDEDISIEEYEHYIQDQKKVVAAIRKGLENGALRYDPETDSVQPITTKEARLTQSHKPEPITYLYKEQNLQTFQDYLLNHGIYMSRLFQNNKRARIARARKVSFMIEQHFKHIAGAEERKAKEEEKHKRNLARAAMQAVKKRWTLAERAYRVLLKDEEEHLKRIKGKEHLSKMLEQSTQLLEAQLTHKTEESISSDGGSDTGSSSAAEDDDDLLTSSSDEEEASEEQEIPSDLKQIEDEHLTEEQLKVKYADIGGNLATQEDTEMHADESSDGELSVTTEESSQELSEEEQDASVSDAAEQSPGLSALLEQGNDDDDSDESVEYEQDQSSGEEVKDESSKDEVNANSKPETANPENKVEEIDEKLEHTTKEDEKLIPSESESAEADPYSVEDVPIPQLLRGTLRTYQKQGLNWMASLYNNGTNGILADEMGLGKTIQTISLLAYLACEKHNWGPHLIVVPTSVLLNWEMELKRFAPGFKVLTYYGSPQQRKEKRKGWNKPDAFHICIVSYQLVVQDQNSFKRKRWEYMILDEAHNIKNFRSTRWQALLNFNTQRRLLLTGTPLQNNIAELWSLLYFLMPQTVTAGQEVTGFADLDAFQQWFGKPVDKLIETGQNYQHDEETKKTVTKLHQVLRPYLLRRLKADVEKQMPAKHEHIVYCRLSKRQRFLYDDFMSRAQTKATLASGNFMSIVNCLMQLRKVCNHPDLFEVRPILTSFCRERSVIQDYVSRDRFVYDLLNREQYKNKIGLDTMNLAFTGNDLEYTTHTSHAVSKLQCVEEFVKQVDELRQQELSSVMGDSEDTPPNFQDAVKFFEHLGKKRLQEAIDDVESMRHINKLRCDQRPMYGKNLFKLLKVERDRRNDTDGLRACINPLQNHFDTHKDIIEKYAVVTPNAVTLDTRNLTLGLNDESTIDENTRNLMLSDLQTMGNPLHHLQTKLTIAFPDKSLLQYDCGKLQKLADLLQNLKDNGHRALIFTQMTKVLDILEQFLNYHGYLYMRLDGATKIEDRQILTERFNSDSRITVFILSSRSGGLGINLTGADTVIFYDSDWNPAMDKQCQDRCHRIGQTRDVHIYRFVSEHTIESNILKKANQKRHLDNLVIQEGDFTTDYFTKLSVKDLLGSEVTGGLKVDDKPLLQADSAPTKDPRSLEKLLAQAEDEDDVKAANLAMKEVEVDNEDFTDQNASGEQQQSSALEATPEPYDEYEGTNHVEEYMLRYIANGYYY